MTRPTISAMLAMAERLRQYKPHHDCDCWPHVREAADMFAALAQGKPQAVASAEPVAWHCFHCGEVLTDEEAARLHFGDDEMAQSACQIDIAAVREMEVQLGRYRVEDSDTDRAIDAMKADHLVALRREEEKGYALGLRDARAESQPPPLSVPAGYKIVPLEATDEMCAVAGDLASDAHMTWTKIWRAQVAAAPDIRSEGRGAERIRRALGDQREGVGMTNIPSPTQPTVPQGAEIDALIAAVKEMISAVDAKQIEGPTVYGGANDQYQESWPWLDEWKHHAEQALARLCPADETPVGQSIDTVENWRKYAESLPTDARKPFADFLAAYDPDDDDDPERALAVVGHDGAKITIAHLRALRDAAEPLPAEPLTRDDLDRIVREAPSNRQYGEAVRNAMPAGMRERVVVVLDEMNKQLSPWMVKQSGLPAISRTIGESNDLFAALHDLRTLLAELTQAGAEDGGKVDYDFMNRSAKAAIRALRGLEQTAIMLETYAPEIFPEVNEQGQVHFGRAMMESAAEAIRAAWTSAIAEVSPAAPPATHSPDDSDHE